MITRVLFVCHGNICRSPMAEFIMKHFVRTHGCEDKFLIDSKATSTEELGNSPHYGTVMKLGQEGIPIERHRASQMQRRDYGKYDYLIGMDDWNLRNIMRIIGSDPQGKVHLLLDFTDAPRDIADPWYSGDFDKTYADITEGCEAFLEYLLSRYGYGCRKNI